MSTQTFIIITQVLPYNWNALLSWNSYNGTLRVYWVDLHYLCYIICLLIWLVRLAMFLSPNWKFPWSLPLLCWVLSCDLKVITGMNLRQRTYLKFYILIILCYLLQHFVYFKISNLYWLKPFCQITIRFKFVPLYMINLLFLLSVTRCHYWIIPLQFPNYVLLGVCVCVICIEHSNNMVAVNSKC